CARAARVRGGAAGVPGGGGADRGRGPGRREPFTGRVDVPACGRRRPGHQRGGAMRAVNLLPSEQRGGFAGGAGRSKGGAYVVLAALAGLAILAVLYGVASHQISSRRAQVASLSAQAARAKATAAQLAPYTSFQTLREQRMQAVAQLVDSRFDWAHAFHE